VKIVSVLTTHASGGAEFAAVELLDALQESGHETVMLSNQPGIGRGTSVSDRPIDLGPKLAVATWRRLLVRGPRLLTGIVRALRAEAPFDVLLVHYKKEQLLTALLPRSLAPRVVWAEWGPVPFQLRRGAPRALYVAAARRAAAVMAISEGTRRSVTELGVPAEKVVVVPNVMRTEALRFSAWGRERARNRLGIPSDAFVVGCVSRFHPKKRNDVVVDATVALTDPRVHLLLAGEGETEAELRDRARPLAGRAHFVPTPGPDVADVISAFDVAVFCPSPTEGAPRAVILAMLAGRACVSTGAQGVHDLIPPGGGCILSPENDVAALRQALAEYRDDAAMRARHGEVASAYALHTYDRGVVTAAAEAQLTGRPRVTVTVTNDDVGAQA
jgi:glycosyltransferase involved in cell wall biosynthesis